MLDKSLPLLKLILGEKETKMEESTTLTPREDEVKDLILRGFTNPEIANTLIISTHTAKAHVCNIIRKLGIRNRLGVFIKEIQQLKSSI